MEKSIGIIGLGTMGTAIFSALLKDDLKLFKNYNLYDIQEKKTDKYKKNDSVNVCKDLDNLIAKSKYILIAVKPAYMENLLLNIKKIGIKNRKIISIAAGLRISFYKDKLGEDASITRVMPNTPLTVGEGAAGITFDPNLDDKEKEIIMNLFKESGEIILCEEGDLDVVTGLSGSGPAYVFMMIEALADGAVNMGLNRKKAYKLAAQTLLGGAKMYLETKKHPGKLKDMVTSPGGTTIEAVRILENKGLRSALIEAVITATKKSKNI